MAEYIDREAARNALYEADAITMKGVEIINNFPAADVAEVKHGRWEPRQDAVGFLRCSICKDCNVYDDWPDGKKWAYCPNCGAKMEAE